jgi:hypothetical protein
LGPDHWNVGVRRTYAQDGLYITFNSLISWVSLKNYNFRSHDTLWDCQFVSTYFKIIATINLIINVAVPWGMHLKLIQAAINMSSTLSLINISWFLNISYEKAMTEQFWFSLRNVLILVLNKVYHEISGEIYRSFTVEQSEHIWLVSCFFVVFGIWTLGPVV